MAEAEENFCKSISTLVSTIITEGTKVSGEHGAALISGVLHLVPTLPLDPVLTLTIDLPPGKECGITLGDTSWNVSMGQNIMSSLPQFTFNWRRKCSHGGWEVHHQVWPSCDLACHVHTISAGLSFL